jgi:hypothetical protein
MKIGDRAPNSIFASHRDAVNAPVTPILPQLFAEGWGVYNSPPAICR